jgi:hypothetical protein
VTPVAQQLPESLVLKSGSHPEASREMCVMEAVAYVAGEKWSDEPKCACPIIGAFLRSWNDSIRDDARRTELLAPLVLRLVDSKSTKKVERMRADLALDWLSRVQTPIWLDMSESLKVHAAALRALKPLISTKAIRKSSAALVAARDASAAARAAAWDAAWDAASAAAWDAASAAAWDAASAAASAAAWDAASAAAWDAAWDAARAAAWDAARAAASAAASAASAAAWDALLPSVAALQASALVLVDRMLSVTTDTTEAELTALCDWPVVVVA